MASDNGDGGAGGDGAGGPNTQMTPEMMGQMVFGSDKLKMMTPYLIGAYMDALCLGYLAVLYYRWWTATRPTERTFNRYLAYWLSLCALGMTSWMQSNVMTLFVKGYGEYANFLSPDWMRWSIFVCAIARVPGSVYFLHRAYKLCNNSIWPVLVVGPMLLALTGLTIASLLVTGPSRRGVGLSYVGMEVLQDIILTLTIGIQLYRSKTGWSVTDQLIKKLLVATAEAQIPPTLVASTIFLLSWRAPNSTVGFALFFQPKLICLCVITSLNSRVDVGQEHMRSSKGSRGAFTSSATGGNASSSLGPKTPTQSATGLSTVTDRGGRSQRYEVHGSTLDAGIIKPDGTGPFDDVHFKLEAEELDERSEQGVSVNASTARLVSSNSQY